MNGRINGSGIFKSKTKIVLDAFLQCLDFYDSKSFAESLDATLQAIDCLSYHKKLYFDLGEHDFDLSRDLSSASNDVDGDENHWPKRCRNQGQSASNSTINLTDESPQATKNRRSEDHNAEKAGQIFPTPMDETSQIKNDLLAKSSELSSSNNISKRSTDTIHSGISSLNDGSEIKSKTWRSSATTQTQYHNSSQSASPESLDKQFQDVCFVSSPLSTSVSASEYVKLDVLPLKRSYIDKRTHSFDQDQKAFNFSCVKGSPLAGLISEQADASSPSCDEHIILGNDEFSISEVMRQITSLTKDDCNLESKDECNGLGIDRERHFKRFRSRKERHLERFHNRKR